MNFINSILLRGLKCEIPIGRKWMIKQEKRKDKSLGTQGFGILINPDKYNLVLGCDHCSLYGRIPTSFSMKYTERLIQEFNKISYT